MALTDTAPLIPERLADRAARFHRATFFLCEGCSAAVENDDWTMQDYCELDDDERTAQAASVETMGDATLVGRVEDFDRYFLCWVCAGDSCEQPLLWVGGDVSTGSL